MKGCSTLYLVCHYLFIWRQRPLMFSSFSSSAQVSSHAELHHGAHLRGSAGTTHGTLARRGHLYHALARQPGALSCLDDMNTYVCSCMKQQLRLPARYSCLSTVLLPFSLLIATTILSVP